MPQGEAASSFAWIYLIGMLLMAIVSPVVGIIMQVITVNLIRKVNAWWDKRSNTMKYDKEPSSNEHKPIA